VTVKEALRKALAAEKRHAGHRGPTAHLEVISARIALKRALADREPEPPPERRIIRFKERPYRRRCPWCGTKSVTARRDGVCVDCLDLQTIA